MVTVTADKTRCAFDVHLTLTATVKIVTVDIALFTLHNHQLAVGLMRRPQEPFAKAWALPGGYIHPLEDSTAHHAAARILQQKTGVISPYLEEFGTVSGGVRDPRGWSLTVVYFALIPPQMLAGGVEVFPVDALPSLAFDHAKIIAQVVARIRSKASYSSLPMHLCAEEFTIPELHSVYESIMGTPLARAGFRRKLDDLDAIEAIIGAIRPTGKSRPAQLYRMKPAFKKVLSVRERGF